MRFLIPLFFYVFSFASDFAQELYEIAQFAYSKKDYNKAIYYYKESAKENNDKAMLQLGKFYYEGMHVKKAYSKAYEYFTQASKKGNHQATYYLGILYSNKRTIYYDLQKAFSLFQSLESNNHAGALNRLGMFYTFGMGVTDKDYKKAVKLYERSSKQGFETAHCNLAYMYASGKGVWQNMGRAHAFAKVGMQNKNEICQNVWRIFNLSKYPEDKGWKFNFYNKPVKDE